MKRDITWTAAPLIAILLALIYSSNAMAREENWQLAKDDNGVSIFTRAVEGSPFLEVKGTVTLNAPFSRVSELMGTGESCAPWRANCKSSQVLEKVSEQERYVYLILDLPWPASDRDLVIHSKTEFDESSRTATVQLNSDSSRHPPQGYVRAESRGRFMITARSTGRVEFTYTMHTELGGNLPPKTVNSRLVEIAFDELTSLRKLAEG